MTPSVLALLSAAALTAGQPANPPVGQPVDQPAGGARLYAERIALAAADDACGLFSRPERALLDALAARSRDDAARAGDAPAALNRFEARHGEAPRVCDTALIASGVQRHRDHADALARTHEIAFPGVHQHWVSERRDRGAPLWRISQTDHDHSATFGIHAGEDGDVVALALRSDIAPAFAVMIVRDPARQPDPLDLTAGGLLPTPFADALSAWGAASGGLRRIPASARLADAAAASLAPASGTAAHAFAFPGSAAEALRALAPREGVRIDLFDRRGDILDTLWFEAGMFNAALAVQGLALPEPATVATASR